MLVLKVLYYVIHHHGMMLNTRGFLFFFTKKSVIADSFYKGKLYISVYSKGWGGGIVGTRIFNKFICNADK